MSQESAKTPVTAAESAAARARRLANLRPFQPGQSKRYQQLRDQIAAEVGGELTALGREYIDRAAELLRRAERAKDNNERVRLTRCAMGLVDRVRDMRRDRERTPSNGSTLDQYLAQRATEGADA
jgi:hypothetical protein